MNWIVDMNRCTGRGLLTAKDGEPIEAQLSMVFDRTPNGELIQSHVVAEPPPVNSNTDQ
ncbi:hypothetical protein [Ralstonia phage phiRSL1]|uniref:Uncharacterized protein n=1 Tax=Ralstonia phage phiRSL1 TaxID=1980924 RepID=B2ZY10_9CAUD|nr:hypothetical protein RSL1_ORF150 [Ralstonia phage phiRSL1]BAG41596.1 hypothetical protein [Ralstonia phage phiRSL1]